MAQLNNSGLKKLVEYLELKCPGIGSILLIEDGKLRIDDLELFVSTPILEYGETEVGRETGQEVAGPKPVATPPNVQSLKKRQVGRAAEHKFNDQQMAEFMQMMNSIFSTKDEVSKNKDEVRDALKNLDKKNVDVGNLQQSIMMLAKGLKG